MAYNLVYNNTGTRNLPLSPEVARAYEQAALAAGIDEIRVVSGGQPASGPNRTGSHRHDLGGAGDIQLVKGGRVLDFSNPDDLPVISNWVSNARKGGLTGFGAGTSYMGSRTIHAGMGPESVWGAEGKGANAPSWLREAFGAAPSGASGGISIVSNPVTGNPTVETTTAPTETAAAPTPVESGIETIMKGLSGDSKPQQQQVASNNAQLAPATYALGSEIGGNSTTQAATQLMAQLMADKRKRYGLSLTGMA